MLQGKAQCRANTRITAFALSINNREEGQMVGVTGIEPVTPTMST